jgi:MFS transporter, FSR family, fosmidomycin resistance protein
MVTYFLGLGTSLIVTGLMSSTLGLAFGLTLIGLFASIYHPVGMSWLIRNARNRGRSLGFNGVFGSLGVASAAMAAGILTDLIHWRAAFIVPGAITLTTGLVLAFCVYRSLVVETKNDVRSEAKPSRDAMLRAFVVLSVTMLCNGIIFQSMTSALPKIFSERIEYLTGGTAAGAGTMVSLVYLFSMAAQLIGGYLSDKHSIRNLYIAGALLQLPLYALAASFYGLPLFFVIAGATLFNTIAVPAENVLLTRYTPDQWRATAFGAKFVLALGVGAAGVPLVAYLHERSGGFSWYFLLLAAITLLIATAALWLPSEKPVRAVPRAVVAET